MSSLNDRVLAPENPAATEGAIEHARAPRASHPPAQHSHGVAAFTSSTEPPKKARDAVVFKTPPLLCTEYKASDGFTFSAKPALAKAGSESELDGDSKVPSPPGSTYSTPSSTPPHLETEPLLPPRVAKSCSVAPLSPKHPAMLSMFHQRMETAGKAPTPIHVDGHSYVLLPNVNAEEDVSKRFVDRFNERVGNRGNVEKARRLLEKMRKLGGLEKSDFVDIPQARMGFCMLAQVKDHAIKMEALNHLYTLLHQDSLQKESAIQLVELAIEFMKSMKRELMQTHVLEVQIKIAQVYGELTNLIQQHFAKRHLNAITKELKIEITETAKALENLNLLEDPRLAYYTSYALEGGRHLKDDSRALYSLFGKIYNLTQIVAGFMFNEPGLSYRAFEQALAHPDPHLTSNWYNSVLLINALTKDAYKDPVKLAVLQILIREHSEKLDWQFTFAGMEILSEVVVKGETPELRRRAFDGIKPLGLDYPGIASYADCHTVKTFINWDPMTRLEAPREVDPNLYIRKACVEHLIIIAKEAPDKIVRIKARRILADRFIRERDQAILDLLNPVVPRNLVAKKRWLLDM